MRLSRPTHIFIFLLSFVAHDALSNNQLLLIDTANYDRHNYHCFITLAESTGFAVDYKSWYEIKQSTIEPYRTIVIVLDDTLYTAITQDTADKDKQRSAALEHIFSLLNKIAKTTNKVIFFLIPDTSSNAMRLLNNSLFSRLHVTDTTHSQNVLEQFLKQILVSNVHKSYRYHTALLPKKEESWWARFVEQIKSYVQTPIPTIKTIKDGVIVAATLPLHFGSVDYELQPLFPLALYLHNKKSNNHYIISTLSTFGFAEITECFIRNPVDHQLREKMFTDLNEIMHELFSVASTNQLPKQKSPKQIPWQLQASYELAIKKAKQNDATPILCAWIDTEPYMIKPEVVDTLLQIPFTLLWVQLSPEFYLADRAAKVKEKEAYVKRIEKFSNLLAAASKKLQKPVAPLFAGLTMTGNLNQKDAIKNPVSDMYGNEFDKIPCPLDFEHFWKPEVLDVIDRFMETWKPLSNGLPITGIFLDFEMYHAQDQTGQFMSIMDFSDYAWHRFANLHTDLNIRDLKTVNDRVRYLLINNLYEKYFSFLKQEAKNIALKIREYINKKYPQLSIAAYNIFLPYNWFYQGFMAGLSTEHKPLLLATFNNQFYNHESSLKKDAIFIRHLPVLLLSKLKKEQDFGIIDQLIPYHDGVWLNKYSRLAESRKRKDWQWDWGVETTPLKTEEFVEYLSSYLKTIQQPS